MQKFCGLKCTAILAVTLFSAIPAFCQRFPDSVIVQETQEGANTELNVINNSSNAFFQQPFNIVAFAVRSFNDGDNPSTTEPGWTAEALTASLWTQPMGGGDSTLSTWADYTGEAYTMAFPDDPAEVNAYVTVPGSSYIIAPSNSLNGFFFQGTPTILQMETGLYENDRFLIVEGHGDVIIQGEQVTISGSVEVVPEPAVLNLCLLAVACFGFFAAKRKFLTARKFSKSFRRQRG